MLGPLEQLDVMIPAFGRLASSVDTTTLDAKTPCEGWVVRDLFEHINGGARMFAAAFEGREVTEKPLGDDPAGTVEEALSEFITAARAPGALERTLDTPFGTMSGENFARLATVDLLVHSWDLARATDQQVDVPGEIVASVDAFARAAIADDMRVPGVFGAEQPAPGDGTPLDALAAFTGRRA